MTKSFKHLRAPIDADPARRARVEPYKRAISDALDLAAVRGLRRVTQQEVARALDVSQANISRIEHQDDLYVSTLKSYVEALGGRLEINAVFPDQTVPLLPAEQGYASVSSRGRHGVRVRRAPVASRAARGAASRP
ncbi:XRE family transcriptional regulator [Sphaerobacter sp.]|uniref:XRE family transcriptional regulator n=1 Tax=Sphaerobacter sp. TaxID=2099654 RepID=UPI001E09BAD4|nr:XRE family transcriptional regulator [Sphaerobacter sp.]MBX5443664.1 XRE family transcriptional regulator [Sphaerobacter sp.]